MTWTAGVDRATGYLVTSVNWNDLLGATGSLMDLSTHVHSGAAGQGASTITLADGTEALPSFTFSANTNTGWWREAASQITLSGGGKRIATFVGGATFVSYFRITARATGSNVLLDVLGSDTDVGLDITSKGAGSVFISSGTNARQIAQFINTASSVNYVQIQPAVAGGGPAIQTAGTDTNVSIRLITKGSGSVELYSGGAARVLALFVDVASAVNYITISPSATTAALTIAAAGTDANVDINVTPKGTGKLKYNAIEVATVSSFSALLGNLPNATLPVGVITRFDGFVSGAGMKATEAIAEFFVRAGTARNLRLRTSTAQPASGSLVVTLRKNGVDTAITFTIAASAAAGTFTDLVNTVAYAAGDRLSLKLVNNDFANPSAQVETWSVQFDG